MWHRLLTLNLALCGLRAEACWAQLAVPSWLRGEHTDCCSSMLVCGSIGDAHMAHVYMQLLQQRQAAWQPLCKAIRPARNLCGHACRHTCWHRLTCANLGVRRGVYCQRLIDDPSFTGGSIPDPQATAHASPHVACQCQYVQQPGACAMLQLFNNHLRCHTTLNIKHLCPGSSKPTIALLATERHRSRQRVSASMESCCTAT